MSWLSYILLFTEQINQASLYNSYIYVVKLEFEIEYSCLVDDDDDDDDDDDADDDDDVIDFHSTVFIK